MRQGFVALVLCLGLGMSLVLSAFAHAQVYRCRDAAGTLVMVDDPAKFPPGCAPLAAEAEPAGGLVVTEQLAPPGDAAPQLETAAREAELERARRAARFAQLRDEARSIVADYQAALDRRNQSFRRWSYGSREVVRRSLEEMEEAGVRKQQLLRETEGASLESVERDEIRQILDAIP